MNDDPQVSDPSADPADPGGYYRTYLGLVRGARTAAATSLELEIGLEKRLSDGRHLLVRLRNLCAIEPGFPPWATWREDTLETLKEAEDDLASADDGRLERALTRLAPRLQALHDLAPVIAARLETQSGLDRVYDPYRAWSDKAAALSVSLVANLTMGAVAPQRQAFEEAAALLTALEGLHKHLLAELERLLEVARAHPVFLAPFISEAEAALGRGREYPREMDNPRRAEILRQMLQAHGRFAFWFGRSVAPLLEPESTYAPYMAWAGKAKKELEGAPRLIGGGGTSSRFSSLDRVLEEFDALFEALIGRLTLLVSIPSSHPEALAWREAVTRQLASLPPEALKGESLNGVQTTLRQALAWVDGFASIVARAEAREKELSRAGTEAERALGKAMEEVSRFTTAVSNLVSQAKTQESSATSKAVGAAVGWALLIGILGYPVACTHSCFSIGCKPDIMWQNGYAAVMVLFGLVAGFIAFFVRREGARRETGATEVHVNLADMEGRLAQASGVLGAARTKSEAIRKEREALQAHLTALKSVP